MTDKNHSEISASERPQGSRGKTAIEIASSLQKAIVEGQFAFNERLPPERDLATEFGSSRGTVRSALQKLDAMNLVSRRIGSGTFVSYKESTVNDDDIERIVSPLELIEVRIALEPHIAKLAVVNSAERDLDALEQTLLEVEKCDVDGEKFTQTDAAFHLALVECTDNALMIWLYRHINNIRGHRQWRSVKDKILSAERIRQYNTDHRRIYEAIRSRDAESAAQCMRDHLLSARDHLTGVTKV